eukprot:GAHX01001192.1.p1 GENE.GAHX01001192.1~~GAHX01001192.1.p1  ORF type:complete len:929 (+),score=185.84 GAHX01001192.1:42-2789(+)
MSENRNTQGDEPQDDKRSDLRRFIDDKTEVGRIGYEDDTDLNDYNISNQQEKSKGKKFKFEEIMDEDKDWIIQNIVYIRGILDYMKNKETKHSIRISSPSGSGKTFLFDLLKQLSLPTFERICEMLGLQQEDKNAIYALYRDVIVIPLNFNIVSTKAGNKDTPVEIELLPKIIKLFISELTKQLCLDDTQTKELEAITNRLKLPSGSNYTSEQIEKIHNDLLDYIYEEMSKGNIYKRTLPEYLDAVENFKEAGEDEIDGVVPTNKIEMLIEWAKTCLSANKDGTPESNKPINYYGKREKVTKLIIVIDEVNIRNIRERLTKLLKDSEQHVNFYVKQVERLLKEDRNDLHRDKVQVIFGSILPVSKITTNARPALMIPDFRCILKHIYDEMPIPPSFGEIKEEWFGHLIQRSRIKNKPNNLTMLLDKARTEPNAITSFLHSDMKTATKDQILIFWEEYFPEECYKKLPNDNNTYMFVADQTIKLSLDEQLLCKLFLFFLMLFKEPIYILKSTKEYAMYLSRKFPKNRRNHIPNCYKINIGRFMCFLMNDTPEGSISFEIVEVYTTEDCMETFWRDVYYYVYYNKPGKYFVEVNENQIKMLYGEPHVQGSEGKMNILYRLFHMEYLDLVAEEVEVEKHITEIQDNNKENDDANQSTTKTNVVSNQTLKRTKIVKEKVLKFYLDWTNYYKKCRFEDKCREIQTNLTYENKLTQKEMAAIKLKTFNKEFWVSVMKHAKREIETQGRILFTEPFRELQFKNALMNGILEEAIQKELRIICPDINILEKNPNFLWMKPEVPFWKSTTIKGDGYAQIDILVRFRFENIPGEQFHALLELKINYTKMNDLKVFTGDKDYRNIEYFLNQNEKRVYIAATANKNVPEKVKQKKNLKTYDDTKRTIYSMEGCVGDSLNTIKEVTTF